MNAKLTNELTERQTRILNYIRDVSKSRNYPPSVREIGEAVGLSSSSTVHNHLNQLERRGLIKRDPSKSRTVQLVQDAELDQKRRSAVSGRYPGAAAVSATNRSGLPQLLEAIDRASRGDAVALDILVPYGREGVLAELRKIGGVERTEYVEGGTRAWGWAPRQAARRFQTYTANGRA